MSPTFCVFSIRRLFGGESFDGIVSVKRNWQLALCTTPYFVVLYFQSVNDSGCLLYTLSPVRWMQIVTSAETAILLILYFIYISKVRELVSYSVGSQLTQN